MTRNWLLAKVILALWFWLWLGIAWYLGKWFLIVVGIPPYLIAFVIREDVYGRFLEQADRHERAAWERKAEAERRRQKQEDERR